MLLLLSACFRIPATGETGSPSLYGLIGFHLKNVWLIVLMDEEVMVSSYKDLVAQQSLDLVPLHPLADGHT